MATTTCTVLGVFNDRPTAERVADRLIEKGFDRGDIQIRSNREFVDESARGNTGLTGRSPADTSGGGVGGFFRRLFGSDVDERESSRYADVLGRGAVLVCVSTDESNQHRAADIMNEGGAIDVDEHATSSHDRGSATDSGHRTIPVVEEELRIGKRAVQRGGVRVFNRVQERPVEEQVRLREEHVRVDRRPADRPATEADLRNHDEVIEVMETAEEPVVEKRIRVVEEVVVEKQASERTETIRDNVRRSDVNVERVAGGTDYDQDFRNDFNRRFGSDRSARYETYAPAYEYGTRMASDAGYRGRSWEEAESTLRSDYERTYPNSKWEQIKDSVRYGWEKIAGRR